MELTTPALVTFLAGGLMFLFGLPMLFSAKWFKKELVATIQEKPGLGGIQLYAVIMVIWGLWIITVENRLASGMGWSIVVPILGYLVILKGATILWVPKWMEGFAKSVYSSNGVMAFGGIAALAAGALMWWLTFSVL